MVVQLLKIDNFLRRDGDIKGPDENIFKGKDNGSDLQVRKRKNSLIKNLRMPTSL